MKRGRANTLSPGPSPARSAGEGRLSAAERRRMFEILEAANPEPRGELAARNPFELLVAVVLSAQATDRSVNAATPALFAAAATPSEMAALGEEGIAPYIRTIGLYRTKARNLALLARALRERHGGEVPATREALEALPGVGRKTANVVLNIAFGEPTIAVDTHAFRVANRTGLAPGRNVREVEEGLVRGIEPRFARHAHHWLILHGRYVCTARAPKCGECIIASVCMHVGVAKPSPPPLSRKRERGDRV
jgi:endonuclease-3